MDFSARNQTRCVWLCRRQIRHALEIPGKLLRPTALAAANAAENERDRLAVSLLHALPLTAEYNSTVDSGINIIGSFHVAGAYPDRQWNALQLSHRSWIKPRLASGRSPDSRFNESRQPSRGNPQWPEQAPCPVLSDYSYGVVADLHRLPEHQMERFYIRADVRCQTPRNICPRRN